MQPPLENQGFKLRLETLSVQSLQSETTNSANVLSFFANGLQWFLLLMTSNIMIFSRREVDLFDFPLARVPRNTSFEQYFHSMTVLARDQQKTKHPELQHRTRLELSGCPKSWDTRSPKPCDRILPELHVKSVVVTILNFCTPKRLATSKNTSSPCELVLKMRVLLA